MYLCLDFMFRNPLISIFPAVSYHDCLLPPSSCPSALAMLRIQSMTQQGAAAAAGHHSTIVTHLPSPLGSRPSASPPHPADHDTSPPKPLSRTSLAPQVAATAQGHVAEVSSSAAAGGAPERLAASTAAGGDDSGNSMPVSPFEAARQGSGEVAEPAVARPLLDARRPRAPIRRNSSLPSALSALQPLSPPGTTIELPLLSMVAQIPNSPSSDSSALQVPAAASSVQAAQRQASSAASATRPLSVVSSPATEQPYMEARASSAVILPVSSREASASQPFSPGSHPAAQRQHRVTHPIAAVRELSTQTSISSGVRRHTHDGATAAHASLLAVAAAAASGSPSAVAPSPGSGSRRSSAMTLCSDSDALAGPGSRANCEAFGHERIRVAAQLWEIDFDEIQLGPRIGEGSFGEVVLGCFRGTKVRVMRSAEPCW